MKVSELITILEQFDENAVVSAGVVLPEGAGIFDLEITSVSGSGSNIIVFLPEGVKAYFESHIITSQTMAKLFGRKK